MKFKNAIKKVNDKFSVNFHQVFLFFVTFVIVANVIASDDFKNVQEFSVINKELRDLVKDIELSEDGNLDPSTVTIPDNYNIDVSFNLDYQYWVIEVRSKNPFNDLQGCTKILKQNGESSILFEYTSEKSYMKTLILLYLLYVSIIVILIFFIYGITYIVILLVETIFEL